MSWVTWGPREVLLGIAAFFAGLLMLGGFLGAISASAGLESDSVLFTALTQALVAAAFLGAAFACAAPGARGPASPDQLGLRSFPASAVGWMALGYAMYWAFAIAFSLVVTPPEQEEIARELGAGAGILGTIASGVLVVVASPISEEVFFRGFMFGGLRSRMPFLGAALISAGIFGLTHGPTGISAVPQLTVLGLVLAWLYEKTGSIWPPILVHLTNNAIAFAVTGL